MTTSFLSQAEIDALLEGNSDGASDSEVRKPAKGEVQDYNLSSQERIVRGRMPTMEIVNERFERNLRLGIFNFVRRTPEITADKVVVQRYSAFLRELVVPTNFNIVAIRPLRGSGLIVCDPSLVFGMIDMLYGGTGTYQTRIEGRDFSATENRVIRRLVAVISAEYEKAWKGIYPLQMEFQRSEMQPQFANIATPSEVVVSTRFQVEIGQVTGNIHWCMPYATLEPIRDVLYASTQGETMEVDRRWINLLTREIQAVEVTMVAELATANTTVEQLLAMQPGDFIELERKPHVEACVDGVPLFKCNYGTHNAKYAIKVEECLRMNSQGWMGEEYGNR